MSGNAESPRSDESSVPPNAGQEPPGNLSHTPLRRATFFFASVVIAAVLAWWFGRSPDLTAAATRALFILLLAGMLWLTEAIPAFAVGILVIALQVALLGKPGGVFARTARDWEQFVSVLGHPLIWLFFGGFVMAAALSRCGLDRWLAQTMLSRFGTRPAGFLLGVMTVTFFLSMLISNTATTAMMLAVVGSHLAQRTDRFGTGILLGIAVAANLGGMGSLIGTPPNAIAVGALAETKPATTINFLQWLMIGLVPAALSMGCIWLVIVRFYRSESDSVQLEPLTAPQVNDQNGDGPAWYRPTVAITMGATVGLWLTSQWHGIPAAAVSFLPIVVFTTTGILPEKAIRGLSYDVLFLMAGGLALGQIVTETGLSAWIVAQMPLDNLSPLGLAILMMMVAIFFSNLMSNTATANILMPIAVTLAAEHAAEIAIPIAFGCSSAMLLPVATPPNAMVYATGRCPASELRKIGLIVAIVVPVIGICWLRFSLSFVLGIAH